MLRDRRIRHATRRTTAGVVLRRNVAAELHLSVVMLLLLLLLPVLLLMLLVRRLRFAELRVERRLNSSRAAYSADASVNRLELDVGCHRATDMADVGRRLWYHDGVAPRRLQPVIAITGTADAALHDVTSRDVITHSAVHVTVGW